MKTGSIPQQWQRYQHLLLENISDVVIVTDLAFRVISWNKVAEEFYAVPEAEAIGKKLSELAQLIFTNTTLQDSITDLQQNKIWRGEFSFINRQGETFHFLQTVKVVVDEQGTEMGILALGRNITDRRRAEQQLLQSEQFYRTLIADSLDTTLLLNAGGRITFSTPSIKRLLGFEPDEVLNTDAFSYVHPEDLEWAYKSFEKEVEQEPEIKFILVRLRKKDGNWVWCMVRGHNLLHVPSINSIAVYIHDDTLRRQASEALKQSEKRFRDLIRHLPIGILLKDAQGNVIMANTAACRIMNVKEETFLGGKIWELYNDVIHEDGTPFLLKQRPSVKSMQTHQPVKDVVMGVKTGAEERTWIMSRADPVTDENGNLLNIISFTDITERKKLEKKSLFEKIAHQRQLAQATIDGQEKERREIGKELHDNIGQQLTTVKLFLDMAQANAAAENSPMIAMALKAVSELINEVRTMSKSLVPPTLKDLGFIDSVNDLIESLRNTQAIAIDLDYFEFDEDQLPENKKLALFRIVQEQLNNVLKHAAAKKATISLRCTDNSVLLRITDDGKGFEWRTTRRGSGLVNITNRAEVFGGKASITSAPGQGCSVEVSLPHSFVPTIFE